MIKTLLLILVYGNAFATGSYEINSSSTSPEFSSLAFEVFIQGCKISIATNSYEDYIIKQTGKHPKLDAKTKSIIQLMVQKGGPLDESLTVCDCVGEKIKARGLPIPSVTEDNISKDILRECNSTPSISIKK